MTLLNLNNPNELPDELDLDGAFAQAHAVEQAAVRQALLDATREVIVMYDLQGQVVVENEAALELNRLFELESNLPLADRLANLAEQAEDREAFAAASAELEDPALQQSFEWRHAPTGRYFNRYSAPVVNSHGNIIGRALVSRDITLEKENERLKNEFIALVSHELRTPLTIMISSIDLLVDPESGPLNEEQEHFIRTLERNTQRLLRIVGDLLFVAQADAGRINVKRGDCFLDEIVRHCVEEAGPAADARGIKLAAEIEEGLAIYADHERIGQVANNLLSNAIKFTEPEGQIQVRVWREDGQARLAVADTGMGISEEDQERLFQRFFRTDKATDMAIQGTGLGLAICKTIVERHDGTVSVSSREGVGTTFTVALPLTKKAASDG